MSVDLQQTSTHKLTKHCGRVFTYHEESSTHKLDENYLTDKDYWGIRMKFMGFTFLRILLQRKLARDDWNHP